MSNAPSADTDPWDRPLDAIGGKAGSTSHKATAPSSTPVPDDWDEASSEEEDNQMIWDNANKKVPMPQVVVTSSRIGSAVSSVVPPASAFQPPIRILKRSAAPTQNSPNDDSSTSASTETLAERTARYNATRERIFGGTTQVGVAPSREDAAPVSAIIRNPKGPEHVQGLNGQDKEGSQGFGVRAGKRKSPGQRQAQQLERSDLKTGS